MTKRRRCAGLRADGAPCEAWPLRESRYCYFHDPDLAEDRTNAQHLGRSRRRRDVSLATVYEFTSLATTEGMWRLLDIAAFDTLALDNSVARNRALGGFVQTALRTREQTELEERIAALEAAKHQHQEVHHTGFDLDADFDDPFPGERA
jgi:hypothetical protein